jgi:hypothetical protein
MAGLVQDLREPTGVSRTFRFTRYGPGISRGLPLGSLRRNGLWNDPRWDALPVARAESLPVLEADIGSGSPAPKRAAMEPASAPAHGEDPTPGAAIAETRSATHAPNLDAARVQTLLRALWHGENS